MSQVSSRPQVVALGGGHGLSSVLQALSYMAAEIYAVVTVADDGGSSGRLRQEFGSLPPGDIRMALAALCDGGEWGITWRNVLQHRFESTGPLNGHALGNLLILALWEILDDEVSGLDLVGNLLGARGRVLPMSSIPLTIEADVLKPNGAVETVYGQVACATSAGKTLQVRINPSDPPVRPEVLRVIETADFVILGPGSWYTSVLPHLLVPQLREAIAASRARRIICLNLAPQAGETDGMTAKDHLAVIKEYAGDLALDAVLVDSHLGEDFSDIADTVDVLGAKLVVRSLRAKNEKARHDPLRLASAIRDIFDNDIASV